MEKFIVAVWMKNHKKFLGFICGKMDFRDEYRLSIKPESKPLTFTQEEFEYMMFCSSPTFVAKTEALHSSFTGRTKILYEPEDFERDNLVFKTHEHLKTRVEYMQLLKAVNPWR